MREIMSRLDINLQATDAHGDIITVVTKKSPDQQGTWTLTWDIRVRFNNARVAKAAYNQQKNQQTIKHTQAERLLIHS